MNIVEKDINELVPYENNPRKNDEAVDYVIASIKEFGYKQPIVIDKDNVIVCGHTRLKALQKMGIKKVSCIIADDLTPQQIKAYRLADNKVAEKAGWDFPKLEVELDEITDVDMQPLGFEVEDIDINHLFENADSDNKKEPAKETITCPHCGFDFEI